MRVLILALALLAAADTPATYRAGIEQYRKDRIAELTAPDGWLAVRGLFWLHDGNNTAGSDAASDVRLPVRAAKRVGVFHMTNGAVSFDADPAAVVTTKGRRIKAATFPRNTDTSIETDGLTLAVIHRADRVGLRLWDPQSPNRTGFKGLKYFPLNQKYRFHAKFTAYPALKPVKVPNVLGQLVDMQSPGSVAFTIGGRTYHLEPVYETSEHKDLFFIFRDLTSKTETYEAGRFLHTPLPKDGVVDLDFNRAYNPPCAFTEFATCPLPVKSNQLDVRIPAGELRFHAKS